MFEIDIEKLLINVPITKINTIKENNVYSLLEKFNIGGSIKIKTIYFILKKAIERKELNKTKILLEASSGNTAISLSYLASALGLKSKIIIPKSTAECKKKLMLSYGAEIVEVEGITDDSIEFKNKLYKENPGKYFLTDQFNNIDNLEAHYNLTGPYIFEKLGKLDFFVAGMGTTGTLLGVAKYLKEKNPNIIIIGINPIDKVEGIKDYKKVRNIGDFYKKYSYLIDEIIDVTFLDDAVPGINDYLKEGYFNGISSGAILSGTKKYLKGKKGLRGAIIAPDGGDYYFSELFKYIDVKSIKNCV